MGEAILNLNYIILTAIAMRLIHFFLLKFEILVKGQNSPVKSYL